MYNKIIILNNFRWLLVNVVNLKEIKVNTKILSSLDCMPIWANNLKNDCIIHVILKQLENGDNKYTIPDKLHIA